MNQIALRPDKRLLAQPYVSNLASRFAEVVDNYSDRSAIVFRDDDVITYRSLEEYSNQVAWFLLEKGMSRRDIVCIFLDKSLAVYSIILACIKTGIAYYAVDPTSPAPRLASILHSCPPKLVFAQSDKAFGDCAEKVVLCRDGSLDFCRCQPSHSLQHDLARPTDPAYIMFTSGSTGEPKGVVITHANLDRFIDWAIGEYGFTPEDRHTHINPIYFDNSVFDIFSTLFSGGSLVPFRAEDLRDPFRVVRLIEKLRCTVYFSVPSMLIYLQTTKAIGQGCMPSLKMVIFGGEGYPLARLRELRVALGSQTQLINVYGPTECTCICSSYVVREEDLACDSGYPPIGFLSTYFDFYLLDGDDKVNPGAVGELCLSGPCVGHGYFGNAELTAQVFVQNPINNVFRETIYRTGDLMLQDPIDGKLKFVGRKDLQVKHQGYRIELEEIQHGLNMIPGVDDSAALQVFQDGASRIIGFVASSVGITSSEVKSAAAEFLPKYMVPQVVRVLDCLPKNPNGKTDRKRLASLISS